MEIVNQDEGGTNVNGYFYVGYRTIDLGNGQWRVETGYGLDLTENANIGAANTTDSVRYHYFTLGESRFVTLELTFGSMDSRLFLFHDDGVLDSVDNCITFFNPKQVDTDGDGFGNACDADLNNDCIVNVQDLGEIKLVFYTSDADADFNGDGVVNTIDLGIMKLGFYEPPGPSGVPNDCD